MDKKMHHKSRRLNRTIFSTNVKFILPMIILYGVFVFAGILWVMVESVGYIPALGMTQVNVSSYLDILTNQKFQIGMLYSFYLSFVAVSISTLVGVLIAYFVGTSKNSFIKAITARILHIGVILPYLYMVLLTMITLGKTGIISRVLFKLGVIHSMDQFPQLLYEPLGIGILTVYILKGIPFVALFTLNVINNMSVTYYEVAKTLGAKRLSILKKVYLPMLSNSITWCAAILIVYDLGAFEVPYLLATNQFVPISSQLYSAYINPQISMIPTSMAMNILILIISSVAAFFYIFLLKKILKGGGS